jgi:hypothetical protein
MAKEVEEEISPEDEWLQKPEFLLPRFNTVHSLVQKQVEYNDMAKARDNYQKLLALYDEINMSSLSATQKQDSYRKLMEIFSALSSPENAPAKSSLFSIGKYLFPISLMVIVLLIVIFARPEFSMTGLSVFGFGENQAPVWDGGTPEFDIIGITRINLDTYFDDWDKLTYVVTEAPNIDIGLDGSILTIVPEYGIKGTRVIHILASDGEERTRVTATLNIH